MKLKLVFGIAGQHIKELHWYSEISEVYKVIRLDGNLWTWMGYDKDASGRYDFILQYSEPGEGEYYCESQITDYAKVIEPRELAIRCECGSLYERGFENVHSFWCPKWEKI